MTDSDNKPINLARVRKSKRQQTARGATLCKRGFHKWQTDKNSQFDVKSGKLVTVMRCERCGATRNKLT